GRDARHQRVLAELDGAIPLLSLYTRRHGRCASIAERSRYRTGHSTSTVAYIRRHARPLRAKRAIVAADDVGTTRARGRARWSRGDEGREALGRLSAAAWPRHQAAVHGGSSERARGPVPGLRRGP